MGTLRLKVPDAELQSLRCDMRAYLSSSTITDKHELEGWSSLTLSSLSHVDQQRVATGRRQGEENQEGYTG